jgi:hypothetical protein
MEWSKNQENALLDVLLLGVLVFLNYFALRWCVRQLRADAQWLRNPEEREEVLRSSASLSGSTASPFTTSGRGSWAVEPALT